MKKITILSGKGGTGKSSITASLALTLSKTKKIICADCDIDASNLALVFGIASSDYQVWDELSAAEKIEFDYSKCTGCGLCMDSCYFNAIKFNNEKPVLKDFSCEGCGACVLACPTGAIKLIPINNAKIGWAENKYGFKIVSAQLGIGESGSGKVVAEVKRMAENLANGLDLILFDSAAGVGCPVIASVSGSDYCVLVVEPTPSGIYDMQKAYDIVSHFKIPCGLIINKFDLNLDCCGEIEEFAKEKSITILGKIPFSKSFVEALVNMTPVVERDNGLRKRFVAIADNVLKNI